MPSFRLRERLAVPGWVLGAALFLAALPGRAIIFYATDDPTHNTTPPTGVYTNSGWQWQGYWRGFTGTPIATNWFLTAKHVGGSVGDEFQFAGATYRTTAVFNDTQSDLALWRVCGEFTTFAPLYGTANEAGRICVLLGRGLSRGLPVVVTNGESASVQGWRWGGNAGPLRWGVNQITGYEDYGTNTATLLRGTFDANAQTEEATLASGDSGGGLFIQRAGKWQLAGIAFAVDSPFRFSAAGADFNAAMFDKGGLYEEANAGWQFISPSPLAQPAAFYASRVSKRLAWIQQVMAANPEPAFSPTILAAPAVDGPYAAEPATVDPETRTIRLAIPAAAAFYQLSGCRAAHIVSIAIEAGELVVGYE